MQAPARIFREAHAIKGPLLRNKSTCNSVSVIRERLSLNPNYGVSDLCPGSGREWNLPITDSKTLVLGAPCTLSGSVNSLLGPTSDQGLLL